METQHSMWCLPTPGGTETHQPIGALNAEDEGPACLSCRKRKLKCSREHPSCTHCLRLGTECSYDMKKGKPGVKAGAIETLSRRIDALEEALRGRSPDNENASPSNGHTKDARALFDILSFFAEEFKKSNHSRQSATSPRDNLFPDASSASPASTFSWRQNALEPYGQLVSSSEDNPRKRRRVESIDSCGNPNLPLDISPEELESLADHLPSTRLMDAIISFYFTVIQPWIPILHETQFRGKLNDPRRRQRLAVLLHAMVVVAIRFVPDSNLLPDELEQMCKRSRNIVVLNAMENLGVENLQALIIIAFNDIGSGHASRAWSIVGSLTRTVEYLQLTVEDDNDDRQALLKPLFSLDNASNWTETEERRRVFWNIFNMDRFCSVTTGWNTSLTADDVHRRLPADGGLWHKGEAVVTPYFNIWDRSSAKMRNSIAYLPAHLPPTSPNTETASARFGDGQLTEFSGMAADMSTVGAFAYCIEATESLSRVTTYFLQQKVNLRDRQEVGIWLTRFKELDLRLVHWKMFLPQKWKDSNISREPERINMDPNLTLAHLTHNASMILLHQKIGYPSRDWTDLVKLPSYCSAETCQNAAIEISTITQKYLKYTPSDSVVSGQFAFCAFVSARVLLVHWRHYDAELSEDFWALVGCLEEMSRRWGGRFARPANQRADLAAKYARQVKDLYRRMSEDSTFRVDILGYSNEMSLQAKASETDRTRSTGESSDTPKEGPIYDAFSQGNSSRNTMLPLQTHYPQTSESSSSRQQSMNGIHPIMSPQSLSLSDTASDELTAISHTLLDQQFLEMDRVISFDDTMFAADMLGTGGSNSWGEGGINGDFGI